MYFYIFCLNYTKKSSIIYSDCINNNKKYESRGEINMKKSNLIQIVTILLVSAMVLLFSTTVNAANDNNDVHDLTGTLTKNSTPSNTPSNTPGNTPSNTPSNTPNNTPNNAKKNSSVYNNTNNNLPKTGIEDSIPVAALVVVFGVSAVYAYKKIKEYKNI